MLLLRQRTEARWYKNNSVSTTVTPNTGSHHSAVPANGGASGSHATEQAHERTSAHQNSSIGHVPGKSEERSIGTPAAVETAGKTPRCM